MTPERGARLKAEGDPKAQDEVLNGDLVLKVGDQYGRGEELHDGVGVLRRVEEEAAEPAPVSLIG